MSDHDRVCVIGAGSSGIAACQVLNARGIPFDCFEKSSTVGGNWRYRNDNGLSAAYRSLHINTSRSLMAYQTFPMPEHLPAYPSHAQIAAYFDSYVDHFGFRDKIQFQSEVTEVRPSRGDWEVTIRPVSGGESQTRGYRAVLVANGHHWDPRWPEPPYPGADTFPGEQMHAHSYLEPDIFPGKRVLVVGIGNSACDIAVEASRIAERTFMTMRRSAHVIPKFIGGKPTDETSGAWFARLPLPVQRTIMTLMLRSAQGKMTDYGLPEPDHKLLEAHPTVSSDLLPRLGHGDITVKPNIARFEEHEVVFEDATRERIDLVIYCTGYKITFPFFAPDLISAPDNHIPLYRRVVSPEHPGLYFIGLLQPLGAIMPLAEAQSEWVADVLESRVRLPSPAQMQAVIQREDARMRERYVASKRHTIQVDFHPYLRTIERERRRGRLLGRITGPLAERSHELRLGHPQHSEATAQRTQA